MADALDPETTASPGTAGADGRATGHPPDATPPMLPSKSAYLLAFGAVVLAGLFGAIIGYGVADVGSAGDVAVFLGTLIGAVIGAGGVGVVAVLVLRAMSEWNRTQALPEDQRPRPRPKRS